MSKLIGQPLREKTHMIYTTNTIYIIYLSLFQLPPHLAQTEAKVPPTKADLMTHEREACKYIYYVLGHVYNYTLYHHNMIIFLNVFLIACSSRHPHLPAKLCSGSNKRTTTFIRRLFIALTQIVTRFVRSL